MPIDGIFDLISIWTWGLGLVFNATFSNISVIIFRSALLVEKAGVHRENHRPAASH